MSIAINHVRLLAPEDFFAPIARARVHMPRDSGMSSDRNFGKLDAPRVMASRRRSGTIVFTYYRNATKRPQLSPSIIRARACTDKTTRLARDGLKTVDLDNDEMNRKKAKADYSNKAGKHKNLLKNKIETILLSH